MDSESVTSNILIPLLSFIAAFCLWRILTKPASNPYGLPLPPGPRPLPLVGNLFDLPVDLPWLKYHEMSKLYGDVIYMNIFGVSLIIIGSLEAANEFFEKRSAINSDRPRAAMINELMGLAEWALSNMPYGESWRKHRRQFNHYFSHSVIHKHHDVLLRESRTLLQRLLARPEELFSNIRLTFAASIMDVTYGIKVKSMDNKYVEIAEKATDTIAQAAIPGKFLVDIIPILKYVPSWLPGAGFKRTSIIWRGLNEAMRDRPFDAVKAAMKSGTAAPCIAASLLDALPEGSARTEAENVARNVTAIAYSGCTDTTVSAVESFILAMVKYPEVQRKAHAELDYVIGRSRLPNFQDRESLPYLNAIVKETMRWQPVSPLGGAHCSTEDSEYKGYFIPKGSYVIGNAWSILHDPIDYPEPLEFNPDRFLKDSQLDPTIREPSAAFGFGRRICPGRYFSDASLYVVVASILAVFDITPIVNDQGKRVWPKVEMVNAAISHPRPFKCSLNPRSEQALLLIREHDAEP